VIAMQLSSINGPEFVLAIAIYLFVVWRMQKRWES
jgi:hypothetical protein